MLPRRLAAKIIVDGRCWIWTGSLDRYGYGKTSWHGHTIAVHRLVWMLRRGPIPKGMKLLHTCDRPACCNPEDLFIGTQRDNVADMDRKGRRRPVTGDEHWNASLTADKVKEMRALYAAGGVTQSELARRYGVRDVGNVLRRRTWRNV